MDGHARAGSVAVAGLLVGYSAAAGLVIPGRRHPVVQAALGTAVAALTGTRPRLDGAELWPGVRLGLAAASAVAAGVALSTAIPAVRTAMAARSLPRPAWKWLLVDIPVGTVWAEESAYRGALGTLAADAFGPRPGRLLQAVAFVVDDIASRDPWRVRCLEIRGTAEQAEIDAAPTEPNGDPLDSAIIRITPRRIIGFGIDDTDTEPHLIKADSRDV